MSPDVIVVGLGSMGAATVYELARRGVRVLGLDQFSPPHDRGAHGGGSRIIRLAYAEGADYVPLLLRAYELWGDLEHESGVPLLTRTGGVMVGPADSGTVGGALESARTHGLAHEMLDAAQLRERFPAFTPADDDVALYEEVAGVLRPEVTIETLLDLAARAGADLRYGVRVTDWEATDDGVVVHTTDDTFTADRLVLSPGAWAPRLLTGVSVPLRVDRRVQHYFRSPGPVFDPARFPIWIWEFASGQASYGLPAVDGAPFPGAVKAAFHHVEDPADPDLGAEEATPAEGDVLREWLAPRLPALANSEWLGGKRCLYTLTPDEHFVLGQHPTRSRVTVAAGFSGHGFKFVPVVGEILADLVTTGETRHPIGLFAPDRFGP